MDKKKRTSKKQFQIYVKYLESSDLLKTGKLKPSDNPKDVIHVWEKMTTELNASGDGPIRSPQDWKKVFREWKSAVRKKAREKKELNYIEQQLLELTGIVAVTGLALIEIGVATTTDEEDEARTAAEIDELVTTEVEYEISDMPEDSASEKILILEVGNDTSTSSKRKGKKKPDNPLSTAYKDGQEAERRELTDIAKALDNIAQGINRFCELYEAKNEIK